MEDLLCFENLNSGCDDKVTGTHEILVADDPVMLQDDRVVDNMLTLQYSSMPQHNYFTQTQKHLQPYMRRVVTCWMLEVCEELGCENIVFHVAVNFFDRFLCTTLVEQTQLQLLGTSCLLLASKLRQTTHITVHTLAAYTDYSVTPEEIRQWELVLVSKLGWDLAPVTAYDFMDHLIQRLPEIPRAEMVSKHSATFIALAITEYEFLLVQPSVVAVAAIMAGVRGIASSASQTVLTKLSDIIRIDPSALLEVVTTIEDIVERETHSIPKPPPTTKTISSPPTPMEVYDGNETPTDITDFDL